MTRFVELLIVGASAAYLRDLQDGHARENWGYEVMMYADELFEIVEQWS